MGIDIGGNAAIANVGPILADNDRYMAFVQQAQNEANQQNQRQAAQTSAAGNGAYSADLASQALARQADWHAQDQERQDTALGQQKDFHDAEIARQNNALDAQRQWHEQEQARQAVNDPIQQAEAEARIQATRDNAARLGEQNDNQMTRQAAEDAVTPLARTYAHMQADGAPPEIIAKAEQEMRDAADTAKTAFQQNRVTQKAAVSPVFQQNAADSADVSALPIDGVTPGAGNPLKESPDSPPTIGLRKMTAAQDYAVWKNKKAEEDSAEKNSQRADALAVRKENADSIKAAREAQIQDRADKAASKDEFVNSVVPEAQRLIAKAVAKGQDPNDAVDLLLATKVTGLPTDWEDHPAIVAEVQRLGDAKKKQYDETVAANKAAILAGRVIPAPMSGEDAFRKTYPPRGNIEHQAAAVNRIEALRASLPPPVVKPATVPEGQTASAPGATAQAPVKVNSKADYDALPVGAQFIDSTGKVATKRGG